MRYWVKVTPNAKKLSVTEDGDVIHVKVDAPPVDGKANRRLVEILADYFGVPMSSVRIVSGHTARSKIVEIG